MPFDLNQVLAERKGENFSLHSKYINPQLPRVLGTLEFARFFEKGEGCYLIDDKGDRYLDFLSGFGVFALGRGHPTIVGALHAAFDADLPNLVQMDCALLPGVLAEQLVCPCAPGHRAGLLHQFGRRGDRELPSSSPGPPRSVRGSSTATTPFTGSPPVPWR